jgi:hypothetical protein
MSCVRCDEICDAHGLMAWFQSRSSLTSPRLRFTLGSTPKFSSSRQLIESRLPSRPGELHPESLTGRVGDWRAGLSRCLCSPLTRPFVCECHNILPL